MMAHDGPRGSRMAAYRAAHACGPQLWAAAALIGGWALRLFLLDRFPLREDEALYAFWARAVTDDPWFLTIWPDKPPLFLWLQAAALHWFGAGAAAARLVSIFAGTATIALCWSAARRLWSPRAGVVAVWLLALSPMAIAFAPTGYTDTLLVFWGTLAFALGVCGRWGAAGAALGAAIMTKQQGLLFLPLVAALPWVVPMTRRPRAILHLAAGALLVLLPILLWDAARWATAPSPWELGVRNYGALALAAPESWLARAGEWGALLWYLAASPWAWAVHVIAAGLGAWNWLRAESRPAQGGAPLILLLVWSTGFVALHLFSTLQPWDRYLLPLAPAVALLMAGLVSALPVSSRTGIPLALAALLLLTPAAWRAAQGGYPVGADHGDYAGMDEAFTWLRKQSDSPNILYHRALGWPARFALFDEVNSGSTELRWFPHAVYLADNAAKAPQRARYLLEPEWGTTAGLTPALVQRGLHLETRLRTGKMTLYELVQPPQPVCNWCLCRAPGWAVLGRSADQSVEP